MSNLKLQQYSQQSMLANGFVIVNYRIVCGIIPQFWSSNSAASSDFTNFRSTIDRVCKNAKYHLLCSIGDQHNIEVFSMSLNELSARIENITGSKTTNIREWFEQETEPVVVKPAVAYETNVERKERMDSEYKARLNDEIKRMAELEHQRHYGV